MKNLQKGLGFVPLLVAIASGLIVISGGIYFLYHKNSQPITVNKVIPKTPEQETAFSLSSSTHLRADYQRIRMAIEDRADLLINNPTSKPEIKIKTLPLEVKTSINLKRQELNKILVPGSQNLSASDLALIISYLEALQKIIASLSPSNSDLSSSQISDYQAAVTEAQTEVEASLPPANPVEDNSPLPDLSPFDSSGRPRLIEGGNRY